MAVAEIGPWYIEHKYTTAYGEHKQVINIAAPTFNVVTGEYFFSGTPGDPNVKSVLDELSDALSPFHAPTTTVGEYTMWYKATPSSFPEAKLFYDTATVGTSASTAWARAVQKTFTFRCTDSSIFRFVILNSPTTSFLKVTNPSDPSIEQLLSVLQWPGVSPFISRRGGNVGPFLQYSVTLNETLRRQYNLT